MQEQKYLFLICKKMIEILKRGTAIEAVPLSINLCTNVIYLKNFNFGVFTIISLIDYLPVALLALKIAVVNAARVALSDALNCSPANTDVLSIELIVTIASYAQKSGVTSL